MSKVPIGIYGYVITLSGPASAISIGKASFLCQRIVNFFVAKCHCYPL